MRVDSCWVLWKVAVFVRFVIWVGVFLVLDHPTRRTLKVWRKFRRKRGLKKVLLLNLITPQGLAQVRDWILRKNCFFFFVMPSLFDCWVGFNLVQFWVFIGFCDLIFVVRLFVGLIWFIWSWGFDDLMVVNIDDRFWFYLIV